MLKKKITQFNKFSVLISLLWKIKNKIKIVKTINCFFSHKNFLQIFSKPIFLGSPLTFFLKKKRVFVFFFPIFLYRINQ